MITGYININKNQILIQGNPYFSKALEIITKTDFSRLDDGTFNLESDDFFYLLLTYKTKNNIDETKAESHKKYIDLQYVIYGEELLGYSSLSNPEPSNSDYNAEKDISFHNVVSNENFLILKKDMFAVLFPDEIHRSGLSNKEIRSVRKAVFKIKNN